MNKRGFNGVVAVLGIALVLAASLAAPAFAEDKKPNILVIWGDDIGQSSISAYTRGLVGYKTPNIDRIANEGMMFTDYYGEQSCTAGRSSFITGQSVFRTGLSKVGLPGADLGMRIEDPTIAGLLKAHDSSVRTILETRMNTCPPTTASTSSSAISTTSTPRRSRSCRTIPRIRNSARSSDRAA